MTITNRAILSSYADFSACLFPIMGRIDPCIQGLELYEFRYGLNNLLPEGGWASVETDSTASIEEMVNSRTFYDSLEIKPKVGDRTVLNPRATHLTQMLMVGLVTGEYTEEWVLRNFYFDIRGFYFLHRTSYFTHKIKEHLGGKPYRQFEAKQKAFERYQSVGYKDFKAANAEVDNLFIECAKKLIEVKGVPIVMAIAGGTAAGKTEIVERLTEAFHMDGKKVTSIELDNFLTDRDYREANGIFTLGKQAYHLELLQKCLDDIVAGKKITTPRYNFINGTSSHDLTGNLKPDGKPVEVEPADIIFIEGNFPFLIEEVIHLIGIKVVYLTDDPVRLKRKWKRDIDLRKKYEENYFRNRYFKEQFIMAEVAYRPQLEVCDICVDTTGAALWMTPQVAQAINLAN